MAGEMCGILPAMEILVLADDATGALEAGAKLADRGSRCLVTLHRDLTAAPDALVVDAETRHLTREAALACVRGLAREARRRGVRHLYKKTDSTLRGHIGAEFQALLDVFPERPLLYVPA